MHLGLANRKCLIGREIWSPEWHLPHSKIRKQLTKKWTKTKLKLYLPVHYKKKKLSFIGAITKYIEIPLKWLDFFGDN